MEIIVTDERDERFVEFCKSFGCFLDDPQVVLLLDNFGKIVGCTSFKVYDSESAEITTLGILYKITAPEHIGHGDNVV